MAKLIQRKRGPKLDFAEGWVDIHTDKPSMEREGGGGTEFFQSNKFDEFKGLKRQFSHFLTRGLS